MHKNVTDNSEYDQVLITLLRGNVSFNYLVLHASAVCAFLASCITNRNSQMNHILAAFRLRNKSASCCFL